MMWPGHWYGMFLGPIMMILLVAAVVVLVVVALRWLGRAPQGPARPTPLDVLRERFARGEIDKEEFEVRRRALSE
jgi:putative membrane protein